MNIIGRLSKETSNTMLYKSKRDPEDVFFVTANLTLDQSNIWRAHRSREGHLRRVEAGGAPAPRQTPCWMKGDASRIGVPGQGAVGGMGWPGKDPRRVEPSDRGGGYGRLWESGNQETAVAGAPGAAVGLLTS